MNQHFYSLCLALLLGAACSPPTGPYFGITRMRHDPNTLWINNTTEPESIDPAICSESAGGAIIDNLFAGLVSIHPQTMQPTADIAHHWDISADGLTYTFYLRKSVWSDLTPVTAHDFVWSWLRVLQPETASRYANLLYVLQNAEGFNKQALWVSGTPGLTLQEIEQALENLGATGHVVENKKTSSFFIFLANGLHREEDQQQLLKLNNHSILGKTWHVHVTQANEVGIKALDDYTLQVTLQHPVGYFLYLIAFHVFKPVPQHVLAQLEKQHIEPQKWTEPPYIVSNGPYVLSQWRFKQFLTYEKNRHYWQSDTVKIEHVKVFEIENIYTAMHLYQTGELDWTGANMNLPNEMLPSLRRYQDIYSDPSLTVMFLWFNTQIAPTNNVHLRRALSLSIDRQAITQYILQGGQIPTADLVPDKLGGYQALHRPLFDVAAAKSELQAAGYQNGQDVPAITLIYNTAEENKKVIEAIAAMWKQHLNIDVALENQEWRVYLGRLNMHDFQIARLGWVGDYPDANTFLHEVLSSDSGNNLSGWQDPVFDQMLMQANNNVDTKARLALLRQAEAYAMEAQPMIPLFIGSRTYARKPYLQGFVANQVDYHPIAHMFIKQP